MANQRELLSDNQNYYSYYHATVPLRRPYSGDPVHLDEAEFGEAASNMTYNEEGLNTAEDLGLMQEDEDSRLIFLQLPASLPLTKISAAAKRPDRGRSLKELTPGFIGKLLMYKSGKVKMKIGDTLMMFPRDYIFHLRMKL